MRPIHYSRPRTSPMLWALSLDRRQKADTFIRRGIAAAIRYIASKAVRFALAVVKIYVLRPVYWFLTMMPHLLTPHFLSTATLTRQSARSRL